MLHRDSNTGAGDDPRRPLDTELQGQIDKRLTLNLLIQGAAAHSFLTAHHVVRDELEQILPGLTYRYDQFAICGLLNYFIGDILLIYGLPSRFWNRTRKPGHPFFYHRLLAEHGRELAYASKRYLVSRGWQKRVIGIPILQQAQMYYLATRVWRAERNRHVQLARLAKRATAIIWGIEESQLDAEFTTSVAFGTLQPPRTFAGRMTVQAAIGFGGVQRCDGRFKVVAKSWFWPLVVHELIKGTAELVCLHGLNTLEESTYEYVMRQADHIEYETWMLQAGPELWRRLLAVLPKHAPPPEMLMHLSRLDPEPLETLMLAVVNDSDRASKLLRRLS